jgi:hypothetical protein
MEWKKKDSSDVSERTDMTVIGPEGRVQKGIKRGRGGMKLYWAVWGPKRASINRPDILIQESHHDKS